MKLTFKNLRIFTVLTIFIFLGLYGCGLIEQELNADAGVDITIAAGETVTLDGTNSTGLPSMTYLWAIESQPAGSMVSLADATTATPTFTPEIAGVYHISLSVFDGVNGDTDELDVTVTDGAGLQTITISGNIDSDITWNDHIENPAIPDYQLVGDIDLLAELTIEAGVLIHADEDVVLEVKPEGVLMAEGTSGNEITFTSTGSSSNQRWKGIQFESTDVRNKLSYVTLSHAGNTEFGGFADYVDVKATVAVMNGGVINIANTTITNSGGYGMYVRYGKLNSFANNTFESNAGTAVGVEISQATMIDANTTFTSNAKDVEIFGSELDENDELNLTNLNGNSKYHVSGDLFIKSYLSFDDGTYLEMAEDVEIRVRAGGVFVADGSSGDRIVFTSEGINAGLKWKGLSIWSADARNILSNVEISHAGNSEFGSFSDYVDVPANIAIMDGGRISINNSQVSDGNGYGLYMRYGALLDFNSNTFSDNNLHAIGIEANQAGTIDANTIFSGNGFDGIEVFGSELSQESTWVALNGSAKYHATGHIDVTSGLTLEPGVSIVVDEDKFFEIYDGGYFSALGTAQNMITFNTSNESGQIYWGGLYFKTADIRNQLDYVNVSYAGGAKMDLDNYVDAFTAIGGTELAKISITNSVIENSEGSGVHWQGAGTINDIESGVANNTFPNNISVNVY